ncbi:MAG: beta-CASP ribonuclease aCPSF1 [Thermofilaceae archaeon]|nr:beta-CASP ribonuclease aCPSF1 [Thermofilaceae archaeon]MCX8180197.1 beta-CASP ribonuclease aCPSF1 [Thermofilaceae archaeon]MDW8004147.1 beta-CASP ribonuclease aCPSF1 [Thermofilaceae archaeon]
MEILAGSILDLRKKILEQLPPNAEVTKIEFEGPKIAIYTRKPAIFVQDEEKLIKEIVKGIKKRIVVRADQEARQPPDKAEQIIRVLTPAEAGIQRLFFNDALGEVEIEAEKPGYVIGKGGETRRAVFELTGWYPRILRAPALHSNTITEVRELFRARKDERAKLLRSVGNKIFRVKLFENNYVRLVGLGSFQEVGRSAILVQTPESQVMLDAGIKPTSNGDEYPFFEAPELDLDKLDAVIITHSHLDHCGALPYLFKYGYRGPVYMTEPTLYLSKLVQEDYLRVAHREGRPLPYSEKDIVTSILHTYPLSYGEVTDIAPDVKLTFYKSGHILGGALVHLHIGEGLVNIVYTGDFKFEHTLMLDAADYKFPRLELLIMEATYSGKDDLLPSRDEAFKQLVDIVAETVNRNGIVLIPVLAVGRAQEVLLTLRLAMENGQLPQVPIFIEGMIDDVNAIHTVFPEFFNTTVSEMIYRKVNPFTAPNVHVFKGEEREEVIEARPCVILATSGMLTGGPVVEYLKLLAEDERSSLVFVSYQVEGTLGRKILQGLKELSFVDSRGRMEFREMKMSVYRVEGFSGHSDRRQLLAYLKKVSPTPRRVVLNHGEKNKVKVFAGIVSKVFPNIEVYAPENLETIRAI